MKNKIYKNIENDTAHSRNYLETEIKYKILIIADKDLIPILEMEAKLGYEPLQWFDKIMPNYSSDFMGWKILMIKRK